MHDWKMEGNAFCYHVVIPPNTTATVPLPFAGDVQRNGEAVQGQRHDLGAGHYAFIIHMQ